MVSLPVIVGFGGINPAGRSSFHHGYRRMVADALPRVEANASYTDLAILMQLLRYEDGCYRDNAGNSVDLDRWLEGNKEQIDANTLIRQLGTNLFDPNAIQRHSSARISGVEGDDLRFNLRARQLPDTIPDHWQVEDLGDGECRVVVKGDLDLLFNDPLVSTVNSAGQLPTGFEPGTLYPSRNHPRGLQMTVYGASDAVRSMGIDWQQVLQHISPDQVAVYASSAMGQLDEHGTGGMLQSQLKGKRVTSKHCPLGLAEMPADFVNAYVIGSIGSTAGNIGACATFLYNLRQGIDDIRSGNKRAVIVGNSEAPLTPEIIAGYNTMGALADDASLRALDSNSDSVDHRRACRPFSDNCGFTLAEAAQFVVLFDDALALELGANIHGAVADVFVNADGYKKSISGPGVGNYITMAKAAAVTRAIVGEKALRHQTAVQAHGTSTPQNRVTESHILSETARAFGISHWPVSAVKAYLGHSLASASGDQFVASLGVWKYGVLPGINTIDHLADDVVADHLDFLTAHKEVGPQAIAATILNSKGFGGNNASASLLAPHIVADMLAGRHGQRAWSDYQHKNETVADNARAYDEESLKGLVEPIYQFGENVRDGSDVSLTESEIRVAGYPNPISLDIEDPYR